MNKRTGKAPTQSQKHTDPASGYGSNASKILKVYLNIFKEPSYCPPSFLHAFFFLLIAMQKKESADIRISVKTICGHQQERSFKIAAYRIAKKVTGAVIKENATGMQQIIESIRQMQNRQRSFIRRSQNRSPKRDTQQYTYLRS
ncbi:hypothetical protein LQ567_19905 [Niabella pedocola]|uniref:Uncharacterized protein n=1 Tax=Niabella pedocola TaxID=1752077 RepID=A0ABS8PVH2_9BACT|nr:hypothetical protein [Niabella pedocola]MCD2425060.1 hypothetical protein [Niabella pedocola]